VDVVTSGSSAAAAVSYSRASLKKAYKSVPENWKALSEINYQKVISDLESILLEISADGVHLNSPDGKVSTQQLYHWADDLRDALEALSKAH
jgi:flagellar motor component MotA